MDFKTLCTPPIQLQRHGHFTEIMIGHLMLLDIVYADPEVYNISFWLVNVPTYDCVVDFVNCCEFGAVILLDNIS